MAVETMVTVAHVQVETFSRVTTATIHITAVAASLAFDQHAAAVFFSE